MFFNCVLATKSYFISQAILSPELPRAAHICLVYRFVLSQPIGIILVWNCLILVTTKQSFYPFISYIHCQNIIGQKVTTFRDEKSKSVSHSINNNVPNHLCSFSEYL